MNGEISHQKEKRFSHSCILTLKEEMRDGINNPTENNASLIIPNNISFIFTNYIYFKHIKHIIAK
jgi:hypothetical protein